MNDVTFVVDALLFAVGVIALMALFPRPALVAHQPAHPTLEPRADLERRTVVELQQMARAEGIKGLSRLRKAELIDQLLAVSEPC